MSDVTQTESKAPQVDLKALRQERKQWVDGANQLLKVQNKDIKAIKKALAEGPRTVPEIAKDSDLAPNQVMYYIAGMLKYGQVKEAERAGHYMQYQLADKD